MYFELDRMIEGGVEFNQSKVTTSFIHLKNNTYIQRTSLEMTKYSHQYNNLGFTQRESSKREDEMIELLVKVVKSLYDEVREMHTFRTRNDYMLLFIRVVFLTMKNASKPFTSLTSFKILIIATSIPNLRRYTNIIGITGAS